MIVLLTFFTALALSLAGTRAMIWICTKRGWFSEPRPDRWHKGKPCRFGGVAIYSSLLLSAAVFLPGESRQLWKLLGLASGVFVLGLVDDIVGLTPRKKFLFQLLAASGALALGVVYPFREFMLINMAVSFLWIIAVTNAFNLLDNMDGLSAGVALISIVYLMIIFFVYGANSYLVLLAALGGAIGGFLVFNFYPARIFMGDAGSLLIGFLMGTISLLDVTHLSGITAFLFVPVLVLMIPLFDTIFVTVTRKLRGQPVSQGGIDHSSHRLVGFGGSERRATVMLYGLSCISGGIAMCLRYLSPAHAVSLVMLWFMCLALLGIHLFQPDSPTRPSALPERDGLWRRILDRDSLAPFLDLGILSLAYYSAFFIRFVGNISRGDLDLFMRSWPVLVGIKFGCLLLFQVYRSSWWRTGRNDSYRLLKALFLGEGLSIVVLVGVERFAGYSRVVFLMDALISVVLLLAVRQSWRVFRDLAIPKSTSEPRALVLGTGSASELALRYLREQGVTIVGLLETNHGADLQKQVWGAPVVGSFHQLVELANLHNVQEIILPDAELLQVPEEPLQQKCEMAKLQLIRFGFYEKADVRRKQAMAAHASSGSKKR
jgi:UDP-GlcNAc:undecaprenyl-phosphate GlcNAc-1-phosphate transferase